jgi:hypothetical protein
MNAGAILGDYFQRQAQEESIKRRQVADDERAAKAAAVARDEASKTRLRETFLSQNPSKLASEIGEQRPNQDVLAPIAAQVGKANSLSETPTDEDILSQFLSGGGRESLDSRNITRAGGSLVSSENQGGASKLASVKEQAAAKRKLLTTEAEAPNTIIEEALGDGSTQKIGVNPRTMGKGVTTGLSAVRKGELEGEQAIAGEPGKTKAELANMKGTWDQRFAEAEKMEAMKAAKQLHVARESYKINHPEAANAAQDAIEATLGMEKIISLSFELNKLNAPGAMDLYAGAKNAVGQVPYLGATMTGLMDTASSAVNMAKQGDPTIPGKVNTLQGLRRAAAISLIRAAGDPRPSNADVDGVMGSIPGYDESVTTTAMKAKIMRDTALLLPEVIASNPGIKGKALLDKVIEEAKGRSNSAARTTQPADPNVQKVTATGNVPAPPPGLRDQSRFGPNAPHLTRPAAPPTSQPPAPTGVPPGVTPPESPADRLRRMRNQGAR